MSGPLWEMSFNFHAPAHVPTSPAFPAPVEHHDQPPTQERAGRIPRRRGCDTGGPATHKPSSHLSVPLCQSPPHRRGAAQPAISQHHHSLPTSLSSAVSPLLSSRTNASISSMGHEEEDEAGHDQDPAREE
ncbi:hypothetical protein PIB30_004081 [Stylosanthes scabra]|uniref:Uncharacterized protein n=1 Tax=Stylosanthes scabra TaxID=79078 RepID=A0ABU6Z394_9FABA|nr:hypothetical protein [Stylosanthes scabra]